MFTIDWPSHTNQRNRRIPQKMLNMAMKSKQPTLRLRKKWNESKETYPKHNSICNGFSIHGFHSNRIMRVTKKVNSFILPFLF